MRQSRCRKGDTRQGTRQDRRRRAGSASLDYVLVLCVILPMAAFVMYAGPLIIKLAFQMVCVLVSWPFM
jgi:hypothetical protein